MRSKAEAMELKAAIPRSLSTLGSSLLAMFESCGPWLEECVDLLWWPVKASSALRMRPILRMAALTLNLVC